jgi:hypothetical protein
MGTGNGPRRTSHHVAKSGEQNIEMIAQPTSLRLNRRPAAMPMMIEVAIHIGNMKMISTAFSSPHLART